MAATQRSTGLQCKIPMVISEDPWGWALHSQILQVAILTLDTFLCQQRKLVVCAFPQAALSSAFWICLSYWPMSYLGSDLLRTDVSLCHGQNHSLTGCRHVQELCGSSACSSHRTCFGTWAAVHGHPLGKAAERKARIVHFQPQAFQGNPTLQQLRAILWQFYINPSLNLLIFSCIKCAFHDNNSCPCFEHTNPRSLQACCWRSVSLSVWFGCCRGSWSRPPWMPWHMQDHQGIKPSPQVCET